MEDVLAFQQADDFSFHKLLDADCALLIGTAYLHLLNVISGLHAIHLPLHLVLLVCHLPGLLQDQVVEDIHWHSIDWRGPVGHVIRVVTVTLHDGFILVLPVDEV